MLEVRVYLIGLSGDSIDSSSTAKQSPGAITVMMNRADKRILRSFFMVIPSLNVDIIIYDHRRENMSKLIEKFYAFGNSFCLIKVPSKAQIEIDIVNTPCDRSVFSV